MTYTEPPVVATGDLFGATDWATYIRNNAIHFYNGLRSMVVIEAQYASGTNGGTFTSGSWQTRPLNTEVADPAGLASLASNQITLAAGTYQVQAHAYAMLVGLHQLRLQNITDATTPVLGIAMACDTVTGIATPGLLHGLFQINASKVLELQHRCATTRATNGMGSATSWGIEVYASIMFHRIGD